MSFIHRILNLLPRFDIGLDGSVYLRRYKLVRSRWFNLYLHEILRSDADACFHDHPWWFWTLILRGGYVEHLPKGSFLRRPGRLYFRPARWAHRLDLHRPAWTLVLTGPRRRRWGFHTRDGWHPFRQGEDRPVCEFSNGPIVTLAPDLPPDPKPEFE